jgi:hypothetical protein
MLSRRTVISHNTYARRRPAIANIDSDLRRLRHQRDVEQVLEILLKADHVVQRRPVSISTRESTSLLDR